MSTKTTTVRLTEDQLRALTAMQLAGEGSVSKQIRQAIDARIEQLRHDPQFQARIRASMQRHLKALQTPAR